MKVRKDAKIPKVIYAFVWILISLVSSFNCLVELKFSFIIEQPLCIAEFMRNVIFPLLIWSIAFYTDYLYHVGSLDHNKIVENQGWRLAVIVCVIFQFAIILTSIYWSHVLAVRIAILVMFIIIFMVLKLSSLFSISEPPSAPPQVSVRSVGESPYQE